MPAGSSPKSGDVGGLLASKLCLAAASVTPQEDVRGYLQETLLPVLSPAIEQLLHHIHESGELQKALRERAAEQHEPRKSVRPEEKTAKRTYVEQSPLGTSIAATSDGGAPARQPSMANHKGIDHRQGHDDNQAAASPTGTWAEAESQDAAEEPHGFDPLIWLSETLARSAAGSCAHYREQIEQRVIAHIQALEALEEQALKGEEEEAAAAAAAEAGSVAAESTSTKGPHAASPSEEPRTGSAAD